MTRPRPSAQAAAPVLRGGRKEPSVTVKTCDCPMCPCAVPFEAAGRDCPDCTAGRHRCWTCGGLREEHDSWESLSWNRLFGAHPWKEGAKPRGSMAMTPRKVADPRELLLRSKSEAEYQAEIVATAETLGWRCMVFRKSAVVSFKTGKVVSLVSSRGWPDIFAVRGTQAAAFEVKKEQGKTTPEQDDWIKALKGAGIVAMVARPSDWDQVLQVLQGE